MKNNFIYEFLSSYFRIFSADIIEYSIEDKKVFGIIQWRDENETQEFSWFIEQQESVLHILKNLCDYLVENELINGDRIIIVELELQKRLSELGWSIALAKKNIDNLCSIEIKMVDDGHETDSFFLHF